MKKILVTGGTGMIGRRLTEKLKKKGYEVRILSRTPSDEYFYWNPDKGEVDETAFEGIETIFHLAGAPISKRWTKAYKKEIYNSRIKAAELLYSTFLKTEAPLKTFISASGVNYYGTETTDKIFKETDAPGNDWLGKLSADWEKVAFKFEESGIRVCTVRTPAVLSTTGGMLKALAPMIKLNLVSPLGNGKQIIPWVHLDDLVDSYIHLLEKDSLNGPFNVVANETVNSKEFTQKLVKAYGKRIILPNAPSFVLKAVLGEMSSLLLKGSAISSKKIRKTGFKFKFDQLEEAMKDLLK